LNASGKYFAHVFAMVALFFTKIIFLTDRKKMEESMIVGILKEIKAEENRVCMTPAGIEVMIANGHTVLVEKNAGAGSGFEDDAYLKAGAKIVDRPEEIYASSEMVMHVKEPLPSEYDLIREGQIVFTYLHLAAAGELTHALIKSRGICIAYETIQKADGSLPLLTPMSEVAGRMAIQQGAKYLEMTQGGHGVLIGGVPGVDPGHVVVIGGGIVGVNAAKMACGLGAKVYILDMNLDRLRYLSDVMPANCFLLYSSPATVRELVCKADVVVGAVLIPGAKAPKLITREMLTRMKRGAVLVDVAIDQGECFETSRPTTHSEPIYSVDGVVHYCVANMPGAVPRTSTMALTNATLPYAVEIANKGWMRAMVENPEIERGANVIDGRVTYQAVAEAFDLEHTPVKQLL
jgi:alanine dehydrogenase